MDALLEQGDAALRGLRAEDPQTKHALWALTAVHGQLRQQALMAQREHSENVQLAFHQLLALTQSLATTSPAMRVVLEEHVKKLVDACLERLLAGNDTLSEPSRTALAVLVGEPPRRLQLSEKGRQAKTALTRIGNQDSAHALTDACGCDSEALANILRIEREGELVEGLDARNDVDRALLLLEDFSAGNSEAEQEHNEEIHPRFRCKITDERMSDPVVIVESEQGPFDRANLQEWFRKCSERGEAPRCPLTNQPLQSIQLVTLRDLRNEIEEAQTPRGRRAKAVSDNTPNDEKPEQLERPRGARRLSRLMQRLAQHVFGMLLCAAIFRPVMIPQMVISVVCDLLDRRLPQQLGNRGDILLASIAALCKLYSCIRAPYHGIALVTLELCVASRL
jgi:hypothetical protein